MATGDVEPAPDVSLGGLEKIYHELLFPLFCEEETCNTEDLLREMNRMRMRGLLCDAVLATDDNATFRVHKIAMSWCSNYFRTLFTTSLNERFSQDSSQAEIVVQIVHIPGVSSNILEKIIKFAYSGIVDVHNDNVNELLPAADQFNVVGIVNACVKFLLENMNAENCVGIWRFGKEYFIHQLEIGAHRYILAHFPEVSVSSQEFLKLELQDLKMILEDNALNVPSEMFVWIAIKHWCHYKYEDRVLLLPTLLLSVRMALLSISDFRSIMDEPAVYKNEQLRTIINMVSKYILNELKDLSKMVKNENVLFMFTPRYPFEVIFSVGGWSSNGPSSIFEVYDCRADLWKMMFIGDYIGPRVYHQIVSHEDFFYVIGGSTGSSSLRSCWRFDIVLLKFEEICPMHEQRCFLSATLLLDKIYAIGGFNGMEERLRTVEYYDQTQNQWTYVNPMFEKRSDASAASLRNRIFVVGGFNGSDFLQTVECYYAEYDEWFLLPPMITCRSGVGCVAVDDAVYAIGGFDGENRLSSVEKYSIKDRLWFPTKAMKSARSNFAVAVMDKKIYVMGGYDDATDSTTGQSEVFDPSKPQWHSIASLNVARSGLSTCTFSGIRDIKPYVKDDKFRCLLKNVSREETVVDLSDTD